MVHPVPRGLVVLFGQNRLLLKRSIARPHFPINLSTGENVLRGQGAKSLEPTYLSVASIAGDRNPRCPGG